MKRALLLRARDDAERTAARLAPMGFTPILSPVIEIVGAAATPPAGDFDAILATSAKGLEHAGPPRRDAPLHVVGSRTAAAAGSLGWSPELVAGNAKALLPLLLARYRQPAHFLYLAARDRQSDLEEGLAAAGHRVTLIETYAARAAERLSDAAQDALRAGAVDVTLHYSKRSVEIFLSLIDKADLSDALQNMRHLALSRDVAAPLLDRALAADIAATPDEDGLLALLVE